MSRRVADPRHVDVRALIRHGTTLSGRAAPNAMPRLFDEAVTQAAEVEWRVRGETLERVGSAPLLRVHLEARADVPRLCQRCLDVVAVHLEVRQALRFVENEAEAVRIDADSDDDVLALAPSQDLIELVEDELLLALPIVPMHADCRLAAATPATPATPDSSSTRDSARDQPATSAFEALRAWKVTRGGG